MGFDIWYSPVRTDSHPSPVDAELIKNDEILNFAADVKFWLRNYGNFATQIGLRRSPCLAESYTRILPAVAESSCSAPWLHARVESAVSLNDIRRSTMIELNESINGNRSTTTDFMCTELEILLNWCKIF